MERREDIRAAMQSLLSSTRRPEEGTERRAPPPARIDAPAPAARRSLHAFNMPQGQRTLEELQRELDHHGVRAERDELAEALVEALVARPALCRGLLAAYLLGE